MRGSTVIMCCLVCTLSVADSVRVLDSRGRETIRQGTIVDLKGSKLTLQNRAGRATTIGLDRVQSIESDWTAQQLKGDEAFAAGRFASALESYRAAFATEKRSWVKRQLLSRVVWCYRNAGRPAEACQMFVRIVREDADTPYFAAIPLTWENRACPAEVKRIVFEAEEQPRAA